MHKRATKQETELRVAHAAELVAEGQAYSSITSLVACLLYTSPSPRDYAASRMPSSA